MDLKIKYKSYNNSSEDGDNFLFVFCFMTMTYYFAKVLNGTNILVCVEKIQFRYDLQLRYGLEKMYQKNYILTQNI